MRRALIVSMALMVAARLAVATPTQIDLDDLSRDARWIARSVTVDHWSDDGKTLYFTIQGKTRMDVAEMWAVDRDGGNLRQISQEDQWKAMPPAFSTFGVGWYELGRTLSPDRKYRLAIKDGDLYRIELATGKATLLVDSAQGVSSAEFVLDGEAVAFQQGMNVFVLDLADASLRQVTDFRTGAKPKEPGEEEPPKTDQEKYLKQQQLELFEYLRVQKQLRDLAAAREKDRRKVMAKPEPFYIPDGKQISQVWLSPDKKYALFVLETPAKDVRDAIIPRLITESGFMEAPAIRPKVGAPLSKFEFAIYQTSDGKVSYPKFVEDTQPLDFAPFAGIMDPQWSRDGTRCAIETVSQDYKTRRILGVNFEKATLHVIDELRDPAWVDGPVWSAAGWMPDDQRVYFISEADGWAHLYTVEFDGRFRKQLTHGTWEVRDLRLSHDGKSWLLVTSKEGPETNNVYRMPIDGGPLTNLTAKVSGATQFLPSPDESALACVTSTWTKPYDVALVPLDGAGTPKIVTSQISEEFKKYQLVAPQLVKMPDGHGGQIYGLLWSPTTPDPRHPAIIYVHGAGYAQQVTNRWQGGLGLAGTYYAQRGYYYISIDYLGSAGYGRDCRAAIYRNMGGADVDSTVAAAQWLVDTYHVDAKRIGIYGGSYGGFLTEMCLFKKPGVFAAGAAIVPVSDWAHYNHWYTARILNLPYTDDEAYRQSSPIYYADKLQDRLLIMGGLVDDNVHLQDSWRLMERLIELKKTGWDIIIYPVEGHGFVEEYSRRDYYYRMSKFFDEVLKG